MRSLASIELGTGGLPDKFGFTRESWPQALNLETGEVVKPSPGLVLSAINEQGSILRTNRSKTYCFKSGPQDTILSTTYHYHQSKRPGALGDEHGVLTRGRITQLTDKSRRRMVLEFRNLKSLACMLTLTYPAEYPTDGTICKKHWANMRRELNRWKVQGCWFLEFQERGAPHFHVFLDRPVPKADVSEAWYRIVGSGDEKHLRAGTRIEWLRCPSTAAGAYAAKYGKKAKQKEVPEDFQNVGRFWGVFGKDIRGWIYSKGSESLNALQAFSAARGVRRLYNAARRSLGLPLRACRGFVGSTYWGVGQSSFLKIWQWAGSDFRCVSAIYG